MNAMPWFQAELERMTGEKWTARFRVTDLVVTCGHGFKVTVPYPFMGDKPFLTHDQERHFVGKALTAHANDHLKRIALR